MAKSKDKPMLRIRVRDGNNDPVFKQNINGIDEIDDVVHKLKRKFG